MMPARDMVFCNNIYTLKFSRIPEPNIYIISITPKGKQMDDIMKLSCIKQSDPFCKDGRILISGRAFVELLREEKLHDTVRLVFGCKMDEEKGIEEQVTTVMGVACVAIM